MSDISLPELKRALLLIAEGCPGAENRPPKSAIKQVLSLLERSNAETISGLVSELGVPKPTKRQALPPDRAAVSEVVQFIRGASTVGELEAAFDRVSRLKKVRVQVELQEAARQLLGASPGRTREAIYRAIRNDFEFRTKSRERVEAYRANA